MQFADIHIHALYGVDDGAKTKEDTFAIIDAAYTDGTRLMCMTPHFHPAMFGERHKQAEESFKAAKEYALEKYPDLTLYMGNELRYAQNCHDWIYDGICCTMGDTRYVLMEFSFSEKSSKIISGIVAMFNSGFRPILAHAERYNNISVAELCMLRNEGVLIQIDSMSLLKKFGLKEWFKSKALLKHGIADFVSSDAHDVSSRPPELGACFEYVKNKFGEQYAAELFYENAKDLFEHGAKRKA